MSTFAEVAQKAYEHRRAHKKYRNEKSIERWGVVIAKYLNPTLGDREINGIDTDDIVATLQPVWEIHTHTASLAQSIAKYVFGYAMRKRLYPSDRGNPAEWKDNLSFDLPAVPDIHEVVHREAVTVGELQRLMPRLVKSKFISDRCIAFGILTAGRLSEWSKARWDEIDLDQRILHVPPTRCKVKLTDGFYIPLSKQAMAILKSLPRRSEYVFDLHGKGHPVASDNLLKLFKKRLENHETATLHGCRSTFSSWAAETGKDITLRETALMHVLGNKVSQSYQRSDLIEQRRPLMQEWADAILHE